MEKSDPLLANFGPNGPLRTYRSISKKPDQRSFQTLFFIQKWIDLDETLSTNSLDDTLHTEKILILSKHFFIPNKMISLKSHLLFGVKNKNNFF